MGAASSFSAGFSSSSSNVCRLENSGDAPEGVGGYSGCDGVGSGDGAVLMGDASSDAGRDDWARFKVRIHDDFRESLFLLPTL